MSTKLTAKPGAAAGKRPAKNAREERLAAALRANLKRRKQQARVRAAGEPSAQPGEK